MGQSKGGYLTKRAILYLNSSYRKYVSHLQNASERTFTSAIIWLKPSAIQLYVIMLKLQKNTANIYLDL